MTAINVYIAFPQSERLSANTRAYLASVETDPEGTHVGLVKEIIHDFIDEILAAFFEGPMQAAGGQNAVMTSAMKLINKTARALANRLLSRLDAEEQAGIAEHLKRHQVELDGSQYTAFRMEPALANRAELVFSEVRGDDGTSRVTHLLKVMEEISDATLEHFFLQSVAPLKLNRFSRGLVNAAYSTVRKASHGANNRLLPNLPPKALGRVVDYFEGMMLQA